MTQVDAGLLEGLMEFISVAEDSRVSSEAIGIRVRNSSQFFDRLLATLRAPPPEAGVREEVLQLIESAKYKTPDAQDQHDWNAACEHIEDGVRALSSPPPTAKREETVNQVARMLCMKLCGQEVCTDESNWMCPSTPEVVNRWCQELAEKAFSLTAGRIEGASGIVDEAACLIFAELCPGMIMGDEDREHYENAAKAVLRLTPSPSAEPVAWRLIATAPKDGPNILVCRELQDRTVCEAFYWDGAWRCWDGENHTRTSFIEGYLTHWRPMPFAASTIHASPPVSEASREALEPFANLANGYDDEIDSDDRPVGPVALKFCRAARAALAKPFDNTGSVPK